MTVIDDMWAIVDDNGDIIVIGKTKADVIRWLNETYPTPQAKHFTLPCPMKVGRLKRGRKLKAYESLFD